MDPVDVVGLGEDAEAEPVLGATVPSGLCTDVGEGAEGVLPTAVIEGCVVAVALA